MIKARVTVTLKDSVLDPQGEAVKSSLFSLGFENVKRVRQGKIFDIELDEDPQETQNQLADMCEKLLANRVIEDYQVEIL